MISFLVPVKYTLYFQADPPGALLLALMHSFSDSNHDTKAKVWMSLSPSEWIIDLTTASLEHCLCAVGDSLITQKTSNQIPWAGD